MAKPGPRFAPSDAKGLDPTEILVSDLASEAAGSRPAQQRVGRLVDLVINRSFDHFKRRVATTFMLSSTFFYRETRGEPVKFTGLNIVCNNPFARFD